MLLVLKHRIVFAVIIRQKRKSTKSTDFVVLANIGIEIFPKQTWRIVQSGFSCLRGTPPFFSLCIINFQV